MMRADNQSTRITPGNGPRQPDPADRQDWTKAAQWTDKDRYQRLYEQAPLGYQSLDSEGRFIEVNQAFLDTLGYSRDEVIGHWFGDFLSPDMVDAFRERFPKFKAIGKTQVEFKMKRRDGSIAIVSIDGRIDYDDKGEFERTHCVLQDITERKQAEASLLASEAKYRTLFEQMAQGAFYQRADGVLEDVNPAALKMFGLSRDQFIGKTSLDPHWRVIAENGELLPPEQHPSMLALRTGKPCEVRHLGVFRPDLDDYVWINISAIPQFMPGQAQPYRVFVTIHDITRQKKAEDELRASEQRFRNILEKIQLIAVELDTQGRVLFCNDYLLQLTGWKKEDVLGGDWFELFIPDESIPTVKEVFIQSISKLDIPVTFENPIHTQKGSLRHIRWNNILTCDDQGKPTSIVSLGEDISEQKLAEADLKKMHTLLNEAQEIAKIGGWQMEVVTGKVIWTDEVYHIHGVEQDYDPLDIGKGYQYYPPKSSHLIWAAMDRAVKNGEPYDLEVEMFRADGEKRWVRTMAKPVFEGGKVVRLLGNIQDITERRLAEEQYKTLFNEMIDGFVLYDVICNDEGAPIDFRFLAINHAFEKQTGNKAEDVIGKTIIEVIPNIDDELLDHFKHVAKTKESFHCEHYFHDIGRHLEMTVFQPATNQVACISVDITERKEAETKLSEHMEELRRWQEVTLGREGRVLALKQEINELLAGAGLPPRYASAENEQKP